MSGVRLQAIVRWLLPVAVSFALFSLGLFRGVEVVLEDVLYPSQPIDESIVIVGIDEDSLAAIGQWPWPRAVFGQFMDAVSSSEPETVAIDVLFAEPSRLGRKDDEVFAEALSRASTTVVLPVLGELSLDENGWSAAQVVGPLEQFNEHAVLGHANLIIDRDGLVRSTPTRVRSTAGETFESFAYLAAGMTEAAMSKRIAYAGRPGAIERYSFVDVLRGDVVLPTHARVFVGATTPTLHDEQQTPVSAGVAMSGVEIQANIANMALLDLSLREVSWTTQIVALAVSVLVPMLLFVFFSRAQHAVLGSLLWGFIVTVGVVLSFQSGVIVNVVHTTLAWLIGMYAGFTHKYKKVNSEKRYLTEVMSKYVSRDVLKEVLERPEVLRLGGAERNTTIFFSDVRGFTTLSESLTPSGLVEFLNRYLTRMTDLILDRDGVVDKYIGDAIMAFWGAPLENNEHALDAVLTALDMTDALEEFNLQSENKDLPDIDIGIGLNTGDVVVGNMGSSQRFDYTVMGDAVNLAARLEGQTKTYGIHILISENTRKQLTDEMVEEHALVIRELDRIQVKGKNEPVVVYQVVDRSLREFVISISDVFAEAREHYYKGDWIKCVEVCEAILQKGVDGPTLLLKSRAEEFLKNPPTEWNGVYRLTSK